jgi:hypothetical protein
MGTIQSICRGAQRHIVGNQYRKLVAPAGLTVW